MPSRFAALVAVLLVFLLATPAWAMGGDPDEGAPKLRLHDRHFDPVNESPDILDAGNATRTDAEEEAPAARTLPVGATALRAAPLAATAASAASGSYYVVQFTGPVQAAWKSALTDLGATFFDYIPQFAFIIRVDASAEESIRALEYVRWLGGYEPEYRLSPRVFEVTPEEMEEGGGNVALRVMAFPGEDVSALRSAIADLGGEVESVSESEEGPTLHVRMPLTAAGGLKDIDGVKWVEPEPKHKIDNNVGSALIGAPGVRSKSWTRGGTLYGSGQVLAICDSGLDTGLTTTMNQDFGDGSGGSRVLNNVVFSGSSLQDVSGHGTHVAGIAVGNGANSGADPASEDFPDGCFAGVAPKASLYFQTVGSSSGSSSLPGLPSDLTNLFQPAYDAGARVHSNSWGTAAVGEYDSECVTVDRFMWNNKNFLILYAGGNRGVDIDQDGVVDGYRLDTPGSAKNCLTVGASESLRASGGYAASTWGSFSSLHLVSPVADDLTSDEPYGLGPFSSHGPTVDGRFKPEIVAPGTNILSVRSSAQTGNGWGAYNSYYYYSGGTSMATPMAAGASALMREYLMEEESIADPSAALVKTCLVHGATDLAPGQYGDGAAKELGTAPDSAQGWGRVDLPGAMNVDSNLSVEYHDVTASPATDTSYSASYAFSVADDGAPFRATLGWTDYPGSTVANGGLVNDLDLRVQTPSGSWVYPDNARNLSSLEKVSYFGSVSGKWTGNFLGLRLTPSSYPCTLESVVLGFSNADGVVADVDVAVYAWTGSAVGSQLLRKTYGFLPGGEVLLPLGVDLASGSLVVVIEPSDTRTGLMYESSNTTGRGLERSGAAWSTSGANPAMAGLFRAQTTATNFDRVNNTVSVTIADPTPGTYTAEVTAYNIPSGPQPYALVMSGLTTAIATEGDASVGLNPVQPDAPTVTLNSTSRADQVLSLINHENGTSLTSVYGGVVEFNGTITGNYGQGIVSMRYPVTGLPARKAGAMTLAKLLGGGRSLAFTYADYADGHWWLTDAGGAFVDPVSVLDSSATYYVVSAVKDNGSYDTNSTLNGVNDPQVLGLGSAGGGSGSSGGGGGCTVGGAGETGPLLVLLAAAAVLVLRRRRA